MAPTPEDRQRLAEVFKAHRTAITPSRARFARAIGVNDSTMAIIEGARPGPVADKMLDYVANKLGWGEGAWRGILAGRIGGPLVLHEDAVLKLGPATQEDVKNANQMPPGRGNRGGVDLAEVSTEDLLAEVAKRMGTVDPPRDES